MGRLVLLSVFFVILSIFQLCTASLFDRFMGFGSNKYDIVHTINGLRSTEESHCRLALEMKDHEYVSFLAASMPRLEILVTRNSEFVDKLTSQEQLDILSLYFNEFFDGKEIEGEAVIAIMTVLCRDESYENLNLALKKRIISHREVLIFFLRHQRTFMGALRAGMLKYVDITQSILAGKGVLHILAETGKVELFKEIVSHLKEEDLEKIKTNHFTIIESNSILHSAVLSDNPKMISLVIEGFKALCTHQNVTDVTPLKLSIFNENSYESIRVIIESDCYEAHDMFTTSSIFEGFTEMIYFQIRDTLEMMRKWSPFQVDKFFQVFEEAFIAIDSNEGVVRDAYFMGLIDSYQKFTSYLVRVLEDDFNSSPFARSRSLSLSSESSSMKANNSKYWSLLTSREFDPECEDFGQVPLGNIFNGTSFSFADRDVKRLFLKNLAQLSYEGIDYSNVNLGRFISILIDFGDPKTFAHFVGRDIDMEFCIRISFKHFNDYEKLLPFLEKIGFSASKAFSDGLFPIHLAVIYNNVNLVEFLINNFGASLRIATLFSHNSVLHYGLSDSSSFEMTNFLLKKASDLLIFQNIFNITPLENVLLFTGRFELINKIIPIFQENTQGWTELSELPIEVMEIYNEITSIWPSKSAADRDHLTIFNALFKSIANVGLARLLLGFMVKKISNHLIKERGSLNSKLFRIQDRGLNDFSYSPSGTELGWSP